MPSPGASVARGPAFALVALSSDFTLDACLFRFLFEPLACSGFDALTLCRSLLSVGDLAL
jgi:hypothetical protein